MSRKIKFRAWVESPDYGGEMQEVETLGKDHVITKDFVQMYENGDENRHFNNFELMQYTGLTDKNGQEIYEGDIVKWKHKLFSGYEENISDVRWGYLTSNEYYSRVECWVVAYEDDMGKHNQPLSGIIYEEEKFNSDFEIIGNIYENKDLLD